MQTDLQRDILIPMRDGIHLAGNLYCPAGKGPWPCLINYMPYHKDGRGGLWYDAIHRHFAERGYATMVMDFRGLGCSEGINSIPFDSQEGRDGHDAVEWVAAQPWCNGKIGMWGTSYGGITALKTAAEEPKHLRAIVPIHATYDNYVDFLLLGGCPNGFWPNADWGPRMIGYNLTPPLAPDPDGRLANLWKQRLEQALPWCLEWYRQDDATRRWQERAIPIERIKAATLAVCGWQDFYTQGTFDYYQRLGSPKKLLMGPWKHSFPNLALIEPVNLLEWMTRWWDHWLRDEPNRVESGPAITLFVQGTGVWRHEETWPPARNEPRELVLLPHGKLAGELDPGVLGTRLRYAYDPTVGLDSISFDPWTTAVIDPGQHNGDDGRSLTFTTEPLSEDWECTGEPIVAVAITPSVVGLQLVAKLCDVDETGISRLVTMGWCPLGAATSQHVEVSLRAMSRVFRKGHRIRLSLALADFPRLWPTPQPGEVTLEYAANRPPRLLLPRTPTQQPPLPAPVFAPLTGSLKSPFEQESTQSWTVFRELVRQTATLESVSHSRYALRDGGTISYAHEYRVTVAAREPAGALVQVKSHIDVDRPQGKVRIDTTSSLTPQHVSIQAAITQDGKLHWQKEWIT